jgi:DNA polymerase-3 subunit beta
MSVTPGQVRLSVGGQASLGTGVEDVTVEYTGDALDIGFNARYLLEVFGNIDGKEVTFALQDINAAVLVRDKAADDYLFVLMPMRV